MSQHRSICRSPTTHTHNGLVPSRLCILKQTGNKAVAALLLATGTTANELRRLRSSAQCRALLVRLANA